MATSVGPISSSHSKILSLHSDSSPHLSEHFGFQFFENKKMESVAAAGFRHGRSPSSDRFLGIFSSTPPDSVAGAGAEFMEAEVYWTTESAEPSHRSSFSKPQSSGILAVLPETDRESQVLRRKASPIPAIPRPSVQTPSSQDRDYSQSVPGTKFYQSAPMKVPAPKRRTEIFDDEEEDEEKVLAPHEIVKTTTKFSVLEGVGRTLKGRDLRQVRNSIWRKTGFLD